MTNEGFHIIARGEYPCDTFGMATVAGHHLNTLNITRVKNKWLKKGLKKHAKDVIK